MCRFLFLLLNSRYPSSEGRLRRENRVRSFNLSQKACIRIVVRSTIYREEVLELLCDIESLRHCVKILNNLTYHAMVA